MSKLIKAIQKSDAALLFYNICDRLTFFSMPALLDTLRDFNLSVALLGCSIENSEKARQVDYRLGKKLASVFDVAFAEISNTLDDLKSTLKMMCNDLVLRIIGQNGRHDVLRAQLRKMRRLSAQLQQCPQYTPASDDLVLKPAPESQLLPPPRTLDASLYHVAIDTPVPCVESYSSRYKRTSDVPSNRSSINTSISHGSFSSIGERKRHYEGYTIADIVDRITSENTHDVEFSKILLMLFPKFICASELMDRLMDRFDEFDANLSDGRQMGHSGSINPVQLSRTAFSAVAQRLSKLVYELPNIKTPPDVMDWSVPDPYADESRDLAGLSLSVSTTHVLQSTSRPMDNHCISPRKSEAIKFSSPDLIGSEGRSRNPPVLLCRSILDYESDIIAHQLCIMEWDCFRRIKPRDLVHHLWSRVGKGKHAEPVAQSVQLFNDISTWVTSSILYEQEVKLRAKVMAKFMRICRWLRVFNNYNSLMAVIAGINTSSITRLKNTRQHVADQQGFTEFAALEQLMSSENHQQTIEPL
ncbi:hypothetical protein BSLG_002698 [Batrachochytrium salamandrivorans]|nr:hypothetical protein BSLG_002698 [Batrachochytrium salamandrivorans]